jgi:phosphatidylinositol alpha-1,6-mannosyltransferase
MARLSTIVANSRFTATRVADLAGPSASICVLNPPVSGNFLAGVGKSRSKPTGRPLILTVGRLERRKGFDTVLRGLPEVLREFPEVKYRIIGEGPQQLELKSLAAELGLSASVEFQGRVSDEELRQAIADCTVFAMPSRELPGDAEGFGIVFLEAAALGKPSIAGRSGGISDAVIHEETGLLVNPNDPADVAGAVLRLLKDPALASTLGANARRRVLAACTPTVVAHNFHDIVLNN